MMQKFLERFLGVPCRKKQQLQSVKNFSAEVIFMNPHHFVIAMDSFKGSVSSIEAGRIVAAAIRDVFPDSETQIFPLADGGEGTVDALTTGLAGEIVRLDVTGPLGEKIPSRFGLLPAQKTAVIEMADAAGLPSVPAEKRNPLHTTTYGLGELILTAAKRGCRDFIIGIGGSATNDAGLGMLTALGALPARRRHAGRHLWQRPRRHRRHRPLAIRARTLDCLRCHESPDRAKRMLCRLRPAERRNAGHRRENGQGHRCLCRSR